MNKISLASNQRVGGIPQFQIGLASGNRNRRNVIGIESFTTLAGPLQSCEDTICNHCQGHNEYRRCKEKCMEENDEEILACCRRMCGVGDEGGIPSQYAQDCLASCEQPIVFGPDTPPFGPDTPPLVPINPDTPTPTPVNTQNTAACSIM